jgi:hypothetical protein
MDRIEWPSYAPAQFKITQAVSIKYVVAITGGVARSGAGNPWQAFQQEARHFFSIGRCLSTWPASYTR